MIQLGQHFTSNDPERHSEWLRQQRWFIKAKHNQKHREELADKIEDGAVAMATETVMATQIQIRAAEVKFGGYDHATVVALMQNQELLDAVINRIDGFLAQAHIMADGRRVFKTEDGMQVFDEHGVEVKADELDSDAIGDDRPTWEEFSAEQDTKNALDVERTELIEFQEKVDAAREQIAEGEISEADLEALDADLLDAMPDIIHPDAPVLAVKAGAPDLSARLQKPATNPARQTQNTEASAPAPLPFQ